MTVEIEHASGRAKYDVPSAEEQARPIYELLLRVLGRTPQTREIDAWERRMKLLQGAETFVEQLMASPQVRKTKHVRTKNPPGHFFSPVVDPDQVRDYVDQNRRAGPEDLGGIDFHLDDMRAFWIRMRDVIAATPFPDSSDPAFRYNFSGGPYGVGDATTLRAMMADLRPKRIIEIGSGYSSACMLDTADELGLDAFSLTCIEPYPDRLRSVLRQSDHTCVTIVENGGQMHPLDAFRQLEENDILFIDSTHVMKTGSDVHYEIFEILPVLKPGVVVHFHDCRFPLEYSDIQIFQKNYSWNEAYAVRALLMYSNRFQVIFSGSLFAQVEPDLVEETFPKYLRNPGSALWLRVI